MGRSSTVVEQFIPTVKRNDNMTTKYFWLNQKDRNSGYKDKTGEIYHYRGNTPGAKQLSEGDKFVYYRPGAFVIFGTGRIGEIKIRHEEKSGIHTEYYASVEDYQEIDPPIQVREIKENITFLKDQNGLSGVPQSGIRKIEKEAFKTILDESQVGVDL
jgi:hypothetical protein